MRSEAGPRAREDFDEESEWGESDSGNASEWEELESSSDSDDAPPAKRFKRTATIRS